MTWETLRAWCLALPGSKEDLPFGPGVLVFKVGGKMFALLNFDTPAHLSLKCDPMRAQLLRETFAAVQPGYHLNKQHWNTIRIDGSIPAADIQILIQHSYDLVLARLPRAVRQALSE